MFTLQRFQSFVQSYVYKEDLQWVPLYFLQLPPTVLIFFSHFLCWQCLLISSADTEQLIKGWLSLVHYCCLNLKRFRYRVSLQVLEASLLASYVLQSHSHTAVFQAPSPASSCKPQTDCSIPPEGDFVQSGHHRHERWRGNILSKTSLLINQGHFAQH